MTEPMDNAATARRRLMWRIGVGAAMVGLATAAVYGFASAGTTASPAQTSSSTGTSTTDARYQGPGPWANHRGGPWGGGSWGGGPWGGGLWGAPFDFRDAMHGEVVLAKEGGGTETLLIQRGTVTEASATSITVKSDDGFTETYAVNADTDVNGGRDKIDTVAKDEKVVVTALKGETLTAQHVLDLTDLGVK